MTALALPAPRHATLRSAWVPLLALCLAFFVEMVDNTVLTIALPTIGRDLHAGTTDLQWVTGAYSLVFGSLLLTAGSVADRFGRRRTLVAGLAAFGAISALVWLVTTPAQLVAMRALLGVAAAGMAPVTMSLVFRLFDDEALRMRSMTIMVTIGMSAMALGPLVAGTALASVSWHWLMFVNTPVAVVAVAGVLLGVPRDDAADLHDEPLDLPGAVLAMAAIGLGSYTLTSGVEHGWTSAVTIASLVGAVAAVAGFVVRERTARHPMLDLGLLAERTVRGSALAQLGSSIAMMGSMFGLILHYQYAFGWSPVRAGLANLPFVVTMLAASPVAERLTKRYGHRVACIVGSVALTVSSAALALAVTHPYWAIVGPVVGLTLGLRIIMTVCSVALIEAMPANRTSVAAALNDTAQELGTSLGVATIGTVLAVVVGATLPAGVWSSDVVATFFRGEQWGYGVMAVLVGLICGYGCSTLTSSRSVDEH